MADDSATLINSLNNRIATLESEKAKLAHEAKTRRHAAKGLQEQLDVLAKERNDLVKDRDTWKTKAEAAPNDLQKQLDEANSKLRTRDHRDAWIEAIGSTLNEGVPIEDVWSKAKYEPGDTIPTKDQIIEQAGKAREAASYLFKPAADAASTSRGVQRTGPELRTDLSSSRGAPDKTGKRVTVKRADLANPRWALDPANKKMMAEARSAGLLEIVD